MMRHKFVSSFSGDVDLSRYQGFDVDDGSTIRFYQVAAFPNPTTDRYHVRRFVINGKNEFEDIKDHYLDKRRYRKFLQTRKKHHYKQYTVDDLDVAGVPTLSDILMAKSTMLDTDASYYGFAPF